MCDSLTLKCFYLENSTPFQFHFLFIPYTECLRLPWRSWSALLSGWLDCRKRHTFIHRGPISECGGEDSRSTLDRVSIVLSPDGHVAVVCFQVWFAWLVLNMEGMFEEESQLRRCVEHELLAEPNISPEQALKV